MTEDSEQPTGLTPYGSAETNSPSHIYSRYAVGDMLDEIAKDHDIEKVDVQAIIRNQPQGDTDAKKSREAFHRLRVERQLNLCDALNLHLLEMTAATPALMTEDKDLASNVANLAKTLATRHALNEGQVTQIIGVTEMVTDEEMRKRIQAQDEAGDGLAIDDIGDLPETIDNEA